MDILTQNVRKMLLFATITVILTLIVGCKVGQGAQGGHPEPARHDPKPLTTASYAPVRTYLIRIEVSQAYPETIFISHQMGAYHELEEMWDQGDTWWTEQYLPAGSTVWVHAVKPRSKNYLNFTVCRIYYIPGNRKGWKLRKEDVFVGAGKCDLTYHVQPREE